MRLLVLAGPFPHAIPGWRQPYAHPFTPIYTHFGLGLVHAAVNAMPYRRTACGD